MTEHGQQFAPCPFCGGTDINPRAMTDCEREPDGAEAMPGCRQCGALAPSAEIWNQRTYHTITAAQRARYLEDAGKVDELQARIASVVGRSEIVERLLWDVDAVARYRGDEYGVPDCINNDGMPYQSAQLHGLLTQIDRRRKQREARSGAARPEPLDEESERAYAAEDHEARE